MKKETQARIEAIKRHWRPGVSSSELAEAIGVASRNVVCGIYLRHRELLADYPLQESKWTAVRQRAHDKRRDIEREVSLAKRRVGITSMARHDSAAKRDGARLMEMIPQDTRSLTARVFGDPIPGDPRRPWQGA